MPSVETFVVEEGEYSSVFAKHRLKCQLRLATQARRLTTVGLATPPFTAVTWDASHLGTGWILTNDLANWPGFAHALSADQTRDSWVAGSGSLRRTLGLLIDWRRSFKPPESAWVTLLDGSVSLEATYDLPQPELTWEGPSTVTNETVRLVPLRRPPGPGTLPQSRTLSRTGGLRVETRFLWPPEPQGPTAGYTAPNLGFVETRIIGLTSEPLILRSGVAQTYSAGHHNFSETFLFEPALDPGVSAAQRAELEAAGIRQLVAEKGFFEGSLFWVVGPEGKLRKF
jgi:hypothetical protein